MSTGPAWAWTNTNCHYNYRQYRSTLESNPVTSIEPKALYPIMLTQVNAIFLSEKMPPSVMIMDWSSYGRII